MRSRPNVRVRAEVARVGAGIDALRYERVGQIDGSGQRVVRRRIDANGHHLGVQELVHIQ